MRDHSIMPMRICFASHNQNKIQEISELLPKNYEVVGLRNLGISIEIPETGTTLEENSRLKALYVFRKFHLSVFSDDSGLEVDALNGEPGVYSARYSGEDKNDDKNIDLLLNNLHGKDDRKARFKTVITLLESSGIEHRFFGIIEGRIINERRGSNGFGYDPVFVPEGYSHTFAELSSEEKNKISHRARAIQNLLSYLNQLNGQT